MEFFSTLGVKKFPYMKLGSFGNHIFLYNCVILTIVLLVLGRINVPIESFRFLLSFYQCPWANFWEFFNPGDEEISIPENRAILKSYMYLLFSNEKILFIFYWGIKDISLMIFLKMYWQNLAEKGLRIIGIFLNTFACSHNLLGIILVKIT